jgi:hypothetical protein
MDFSSLLKYETLRFLYSIIFPGVLISFVLTLITGNIFINLKLLLDLNIQQNFINNGLFIFYIFIGGFLIEIIGVYIESKYIDTYVSSKSNIDNDKFSLLWNKYLMIKRGKTEDLLLVDYYRSILTKMKFLINISVSLILSFIILLISNCTLNIYFFNLQTLEGFKGLIKLGIFVIIISYLSYKRAKYCALLLFNARKKLILQANI